MNDQMLQDILAVHAESLNNGIDNSAWVLSYYRDIAPRQKYEELESLLSLARQLKSLLVPVYGREQFVAHLEDELLSLNGSQQLGSDEADGWAWPWWGAAAAGSIIAGVAGMIVWRKTRPADSHITIMQ
jgi:hypothetical protein